MSKPNTYAALLRLADRIEFGHLLAETQPVQFLDTVGAELDSLRAQLQAASACIDVADRLANLLSEEYHEARAAFERVKAGGEP
jgi:hypothetical protein